jgi:tetratricopeptide (TPR) repeat protein
MRPVLAFVLVVGCGGGSSTPDPDAGSAVDASDRPAGVGLCYSDAAAAHPATGAFLAALRAEAREVRVDRIAALEAAADELPDEEQVHLFLGLAHLWRLAAPLPGEDDLATQAASGFGARDHLARAYELCPTDHRIPAWLGPVLVQMGRAIGDDATVQQGLDVLDQGIAHYPSFVLFSKLLVYADYPRDAPEYQNALDAVVDDIDACALTPADPACTNATVPHNREGAGVFLGDALAKAGRRDEALALYTEAAEGADFATWTYQADLNARIADLDARIALFANADPDDDPASAWNAITQCALCHQQ